MVTTRSQAARGKAATSHIPKTEHRTQAANLEEWLSDYPDYDWSQLHIMREWDMTFEPSQDELFRRFGGELLAPHFAPPEEFWAESRKDVVTKWICDEALRLCKRRTNPRFDVCIGDEDIVCRDEKLLEARSFIEDFREGKYRRGQQIRNIRVPKIDKSRRHPAFISDAHIIENNHATIYLHSPGSQTELHSDAGQGGALCFGVKLWAFFPPTEKNMELMRKHLSLLGAADGRSKSFWLENRLEHGVWLTQEPGELLYTPSAAPHAVFTFAWAPLITAHVDTAETFVRNLGFLPTYLAYPPHRDVERVHLLLSQLTPERLGNRTFAELRSRIAGVWPEVEDAARQAATPLEWKETRAALRKMFEGVPVEEQPRCAALGGRNNGKENRECRKRKVSDRDYQGPKDPRSQNKSQRSV